MVSSLAQLGGNGSPHFADDNSFPLIQWKNGHSLPLHTSQSQKDGERENIAFAPSATAATATAAAVPAVATAATVVLLQYSHV